MISADVKANVKQEIIELVAVFLEKFYKKYIQHSNLKYDVKRACIFHLILVGIQYTLIFSFSNSGSQGWWGGGERESYLADKIY